MYDLLQHDIHVVVLLEDLYDALVRGQDSRAVHLDRRQLALVLPKYYVAACQQSPEEAGFCVNTRRL